MRRYLNLMLAAGLSATSMPAQAEDVLRMQPASKWVVNYADDGCRLAREFRSGDHNIVLLMDQFAPGESFKMTFVGDVLDVDRRNRRFDIELRFGPNEAQSETTAVAGKLAGKDALIVMHSQSLAPLTEAEIAAIEDAERRRVPHNVPPIGPAREAAATWLAVTKGIPVDLVLDTGPMNKPLDALRACSWDMVRHWGLDVEQQKTLSREPMPKDSDGNWMKASDYPLEMIRGGYEGIVHYRLMLDASGKPTSCHIQSSTRPKEFDDAVCRGIMRRAEFHPALDSQGKPVPSFWRQTVSFVLR